MRALSVILLLTTLAFAGCTSSGDGDGSVTSSSTTSTTTTGAPMLGVPTLQADVLNGTAPLAVNFTLNTTGTAQTWHLSFGDGGIANGTVLPALVNHTFVVGGNFTANFTVSYVGGNASTNVTLAIAVPQTAAGPAPPDVTHFEFADSLGCLGDIIGVENCISFAGGPDASGIDGYWLALDERYWGLTFTSTVDQSNPALSDSDCAVTDADHTVLDEPNNGGDPCGGTIPAGTAFLFLYPYGAPGLSMTVDFVV